MLSKRIDFRISEKNLNQIDKLVNINEFRNRSDFLKQATNKMLEQYQTRLAEKTFFTIGYEGKKLNEFIDVLKGNRVSRLIDVREIPLSRKKGFSKGALSGVLESNGIQYIHIKELGSPKKIRDQYKQNQDVVWFMKKYRDYLDNLNGPFTRAKKFAEQEGTCLMCFERDFTLCHRSIIADKINEEAGSRPIHL